MCRGGMGVTELTCGTQGSFPSTHESLGLKLQLSGLMEFAFTCQGTSPALPPGFEYFSDGPALAKSLAHVTFSNTKQDKKIGAVMVPALGGMGTMWLDKTVGAGFEWRPWIQSSRSSHYTNDSVSQRGTQNPMSQQH